MHLLICILHTHARLWGVEYQLYFVAKIFCGVVRVCRFRLHSIQLAYHSESSNHSREISFCYGDQSSLFVERLLCVKQTEIHRPLVLPQGKMGVLHIFIFINVFVQNQYWFNVVLGRLPNWLWESKQSFCLPYTFLAREIVIFSSIVNIYWSCVYIINNINPLAAPADAPTDAISDRFLFIYGFCLFLIVLAHPMVENMALESAFKTRAKKLNLSRGQ